MVQKTFAWIGHVLAAVVVLYAVFYGSKAALIGISLLLGVCYLGRLYLGASQPWLYSAVFLLAAAYLLSIERLLGVHALLVAWLPVSLLLQILGPDPLPIPEGFKKAAPKPPAGDRPDLAQGLAVSSRMVLALLIGYLLLHQQAIASEYFLVIPLVLLAVYELRLVRHRCNSWYLFSAALTFSSAYYFLLHQLVHAATTVIMGLWIALALLYLPGAYVLRRTGKEYVHGLFAAACTIAAVAVTIVVLTSFVQNRIAPLQALTDSAGLQAQPLPFDQVSAALAAKVSATGLPRPQPDAAKNVGGVFVFLAAALIVALMRITYERNEFVFMLVLLLGLAGYFFVLVVEDPFYRGLINSVVYGLILLSVVFVSFLIKEFFNLSWSVADFLSEHYTRILYAFIPVALVGVYVLVDYTMSVTENSHFCGSCHLMTVQFESWKKDKHAEKGVACFDCHYSPGLLSFLKGRMSGMVMVVKNFTGLARSKFPASVSDQSCKKCHMDGTLKDRVKIESWLTYKKNVKFNHQVMVHQSVSGINLKCTSCHNHYQYDPESKHLSVPEAVCYACHLMKRKQETGTAVGNCYTCHYRESIEKDLDTLVTVGNGEVTRDKCLHCHWNTDKFDDAVYQHKVHVSDHQDFTQPGIACLDCHERVYHGNVNTLLNPGA